MSDGAVTGMRLVRGDGVDLAVHERGAGPTVLLVHGYPDTHAVWDDVARLLAGRFHVVSYDVRGAGASTRPAGRAAYRSEHLVADMRAVLDATSPGAPVHLVGHDWGSIQSWEAVAAMPDRFVSFTSISGPCLGHAAHWTRTRLRDRSGASAVARQALRSWYIAAFQVPVVPELIWRLWLAPRWARRLRRAEGVPAGRARPARTLSRDAVTGLELYRANMGGRSHRPHRIHVPTQVVVPSRDAYVTVELAAEAARPFTDALRVRYVDAPHWMPLADAGTLARLITEHAENPARGRTPGPDARAGRKGQTSAPDDHSGRRG